MLGSLPIVQKICDHKANTDFMLDPAEFLKVQNGLPTGKQLTPVVGAAVSA